MAGVKGRSGGPRANSGGARPGSGRKRKPIDPSAAPAAAEDPLAFLVGVMNDAKQDPRLRVRAAVAAAQYVHTKTHDGGKKDARSRAADAAGTGKFAPAAAPKLVVNNR